MKFADRLRMRRNAPPIWAACFASIATVAVLTAGCATAPRVSARRYVVCTVLFGCAYRSEMRASPRLIGLSMDGSLYVTSITWQNWGKGTAAGIGTAHADNCKPNCAQGTYSKHPATITVSHPVPWHGLMAYSRLTYTIRAIRMQHTIKGTALIPARLFAPPPSQPASPGPVSTHATLVGNCVMGYEPAYTDSNGNIAYGPFTTGQPVPYTRIGDTKYTPAIAYQVTLTNNGTSTAQASGFAVAFYDATGAELGSSQISLNQSQFITSNQSLSWTMYSGTDTFGNSLQGDGATGIQDNNVPSDGSAATCSFLQWYHP